MEIDKNILVMIPGHAVYRGLQSSHRTDDAYWVGGFPNEAKFYVQHADQGVKLAETEGGLLIFSGGQTREKAGPISEAQSYWILEDQVNWHGTEVQQRSTTEEFARDSLENVVFSLARYNEILGRLPEKLIVAGWGFKKDRYNHHIQTIKSLRGLDNLKFEYIEVNNPEGEEADETTALGTAIKFERKTLEDFKLDPLGKEKKLYSKKLQRNPFSRTHPYKSFN